MVIKSELVNDRELLLVVENGGESQGMAVSDSVSND